MYPELVDASVDAVSSFAVAESVVLATFDRWASFKRSDEETVSVSAEPLVLGCDVLKDSCAVSSPILFVFESVGVDEAMLFDDDGWMSECWWKRYCVTCTS